MRLPVIVLISFFITACGFQLRGLNHQLSDQLSSIYLNSSAANSSFKDRVKNLIKSSGGKLVNSDTAKTAIYLSPIESYSRQISLSSNGALKEYEKNYKITVTLVNLADKVQIGQRTLSNTQYLQLSDLSPQAGEEQNMITTSAAENQLAQAIMSYLSSFK